MTRPRIERLADDLYVIDAFMESRPQRLACYLYDTPERVLIEVGPSSTLDHLVASLDHLGIDDLATIVVTHIHLDHAGGTGHLATRYPRANIGVHRQGARHLENPDRLWRSAARVYGEERLAAMWGRMEPIASDRLQVLDEGSVISLGGQRKLTVLHTPGHADHHVAFFDEHNGGLFVGDALGVCYPHGHFVMPVTPPPEFNPRAAAIQMHRMSELGAQFIGFAHFGPASDVASKLAEAEQRMWQWVGMVRAMRHLDDDAAARELRAQTYDAYLAMGFSRDDLDSYDATVFWPMQVTGIRRWLSQQEP